MKNTLLVVAVFVLGILAGRQLYRPRARIVMGGHVPFERFQIYARPGVRVCGLEKDVSVSLKTGHTWEECAKLALAMQGINAQIPALPNAK
jgi:hypothetical protein